MKDVILYRWIFFSFSVKILANPVPTANDYQYDKNPIPTALDDTHLANCASSTMMSPDDVSDSSQNLNIFRRKSSSCSVHQSNAERPTSAKPKYKILPDFLSRPSEHFLEKTIQSKCPYQKHSLLLYCSGPEIEGYETVFPNTQSILYSMVLNCLDGKRLS